MRVRGLNEILKALIDNDNNGISNQERRLLQQGSIKLSSQFFHSKL